jgi:signal transduction histidine kinase
MNVGFLKTVSEKFGIKLFFIFTIFIFAISFSFTVFFIHHQSKSLTDGLINNGRLLARILSYSSKIGVFSENEKLLKDPVEGILQQEGVLEVSVFNQLGELLKKQERSELRNQGESIKGDEGTRNKIFLELRQSRSPLYLEHNDKLEFWSAVFIGAGYSTEESLFFEEDPFRRNDRIIGFVRVTVDKGILHEKLNNPLSKSILIGAVFLMLGSGVTYLVVKGITRPLSRLTEGVKALGSRGFVQKVPVETEDEIGKLGKAFNIMSESLAKREEALRESEKKLRLLSSQLLKAQEKERMRLSKELHDELGQALALLKHRLRSIQKNLQEGQASLRQECEDASQYMDQIIDNLRRLSRDLSPSILEDLGLSAALRWLIEGFARQHSIQASLGIENIDRLFSQDAQTNLYRIFQEALTNISKHADASHVSFFVKKENNRVFFLLEDNGKGFNMDQVKATHSPEKGMGFATMQERVRMLGANLDIWSQEGVGTRVTFTIPIDKGGIA